MPEPRFVLQPWLGNLTFMQQSVLLTAIRGPDTLPKNHVAKAILRWYRRCILLHAFDGQVIDNPYDDHGGSFTGPIPSPYETIEDALDAYLKSVDEVPHHFHLHLMHAAEILGYKHPDFEIARWWQTAYCRMVNDMHLFPEPEDCMDRRLGDSEHQWREAEEVVADTRQRPETEENDNAVCESRDIRFDPERGSNRMDSLVPDDSRIPGLDRGIGVVREQTAEEVAAQPAGQPCERCLRLEQQCRNEVTRRTEAELKLESLAAGQPEPLPRDEDEFIAELTSEYAGMEYVDGLYFTVAEIRAALHRIAQPAGQPAAKPHLKDVPRAERERAEQWLRDCQIRGWLQDQITGEMHDDAGHVWRSIVEFAKSHGYLPAPPDKEQP